jgi:hypothetical protein
MGWRSFPIKTEFLCNIRHILGRFYYINILLQVLINYNFQQNNIVHSNHFVLVLLHSALDYVTPVDTCFPHYVMTWRTAFVEMG